MRRERVERGVYRSERVGGWVYEIGWYDSDGKQRWMVVGKDLERARQLRQEYAANSVGGAAKYQQLRKDLFEIAAVAERYEAPNRRMIVEAIRDTKGKRPRTAWLRLAGIALAMSRQFERRT